MTKAEIVSQIASANGLEKSIVSTIIEEFMKTVQGSLEQNENVYFRKFGSFIIKRREEKTARNISNNTTIIVPAHNVPIFKPSKEFAKRIK